MKETTKKLREQAIAELQPFMGQLAQEGVSQNEIVKTIETIIKSRIDNFYKKKKNPEPLSDYIEEAMGLMKDADSKAERIVHDILRENKIDFIFQYPIGSYRADFLIGGSTYDLVLELDGPKHNKETDEKRDAYMREMGYRVVRVPIWILAINPQAVIEEIREHIK